MRVPTDAEGRYRFSMSQFRTYGAAENRLDSTEPDRGCPRRYKRKYVDGDEPPGIRPANLMLGTMIHSALEFMEKNDTGVAEALEACWSTHLAIEHWHDAKQMLDAYVERGGPMTRFATLASEIDLSAVLYEDEEFGPVMYRGILDWVGLDLDDPNLLHGVDFKTNWMPPDRAAVRKDTQLKGYDWLLRENWLKLGLPDVPRRTVMHMDTLRYRDVDVRFAPEEIEDWHDWAVAVARTILRDTEAKPHLNDGCSTCPVRDDCPKWLALPGTARSTVLRARGGTPDQVWARRQEMAQARKLLDDGIKECDEILVKEMRAQHGELEFGDQHWSETTGWAKEVDWPRLQSLLGVRFFDALSVTKSRLDELGRELGMKEALLACLRNVPSGRTVKKTKV